MLFLSFRTGRGNNFTEGERELRDRATEKKGVERGVPDRAKHRKGRGQQEGGERGQEPTALAGTPLTLHFCT